MDWVKLSSHYYADAKVLKAGPTAELLFVQSLAYCGEQEKGGLVPTSALPMLVLGLPANARTKGPAALVTVGPWETVDGGSGIPGWDDYQVGVARHRRGKAATRAGLPTATTDPSTPATPAPTTPPRPADRGPCRPAWRHQPPTRRHHPPRRPRSPPPQRPLGHPHHRPDHPHRPARRHPRRHHPRQGHPRRLPTRPARPVRPSLDRPLASPPRPRPTPRSP